MECILINLYKGDCLEVMDKLIADGVKVDAIITDPPYGTTACKWDTVIPFDQMWERLNKLIKPNGAIVLFAQCPFDKSLGCSNINNLKYEWIWRKAQGTGHLNAKKQPMKEHENILVFYKKQCTYNPQMVGDEKRVVKRSGKESKTENYGRFIELSSSEYVGRYPKTIQYFDKSKDVLHPTQKPVTLMEYLVKTYTNEGETVLDFTMGSGTTGVACKNTTRNFIGIEMDDKYFEIAQKRIND